MTKFKVEYFIFILIIIQRTNRSLKTNTAKTYTFTFNTTNIPSYTIYKIVQ